jgi:glycyl-tRNA synthetase
LDSRGAIGVTERQALFGRMRELSRRVAEAYLEQRQRLEYPWQKEEAGGPVETRPSRQPVAADSRLAQVPTGGPAPMLVEIGTEELPAGDLDSVLQQLRERVPALLNELRLEHGPVLIMGTPRRLVVSVADLASRQADLEQVIKGPPADRAFGPDGLPTQAAVGFARSKGIDLADLMVREIDGGRYAAAVVRQAGRPAQDVLGETLPNLIAGLRFDKTMRWNSTNVAFSRPVRWLLALQGQVDPGTGQTNYSVLPFSYAGLQSGNKTRGLRFRDPQEIAVGSPEEYYAALESQGILLDGEKRRAEILRQVKALASNAGGSVKEDSALLAEVTNLVEAPTALRGTFSTDYLKLPGEVLISVMKKHQRYFPVYQDSEDALLPCFIAVRNGDDFGLEMVTDGNEHVIRARFADANYFVREDIKQPLESYLPRLRTLTFQVKLGSMLDKTQRITSLTEEIADGLGLSADEKAITRRAAELCKADLATQMVVEMTSLQGYMGRHYALRSGEPPEVAQAIFEHYLPRFPGDSVPQSCPGLVIGLADRLDTLTGLFAAGLAPSGNKDPFAQRRAALGLVQNLLSWELEMDLRQALAQAAAHLPVAANPASQAAVLDFVVERLRNVLLDRGWRYDVVDAVLAVQGHNPALAGRSVQELSGWAARPDWSSILPAYARCVRITRDLQERFPVDPAHFAEPAEGELYAALLKVEAQQITPGSLQGFLSAFEPAIPAINRFFDAVLVMAEDERLRRNRLGLLQRIAALADGVADFSRLEGF